MTEVTYCMTPLVLWHDVWHSTKIVITTVGTQPVSYNTPFGVTTTPQHSHRICNDCFGDTGTVMVLWWHCDSSDDTETVRVLWRQCDSKYTCMTVWQSCCIDDSDSHGYGALMTVGQSWYFDDTVTVMVLWWHCDSHGALMKLWQSQCFDDTPSQVWCTDVMTVTEQFDNTGWQLIWKRMVPESMLWECGSVPKRQRTRGMARRAEGVSPHWQWVAPSGNAQILITHNLPHSQQELPKWALRAWLHKWVPHAWVHM